ncbi:Uncharacterised protein [Mycobacteroides abscessus subsp. abscessus]|nr:Uncharacterised protein [Mycobacteroides abscessus subsp. abscessus]
MFGPDGADRRDGVESEFGPSRERAAVLVGAGIACRRKELVLDVSMGSVHLEHLETCA